MGRDRGTARLPRLTSLHLAACGPSLCDAAAFRLAPLAPALRQLGITACEGVTDISLTVLLKAATGCVNGSSMCVSSLS